MMAALFSLKKSTSQLIDESSSQIRRNSSALDKKYLLLQKKEASLVQRIDTLKRKPIAERSQSECMRLCKELVQVRKEIAVNVQRSDRLIAVKAELEAQKERENQIKLLSSLSAAKSRMAQSTGKIESIKSMSESSKVADQSLTELDACLSEAFDPPQTSIDEDDLLIQTMYEDIFTTAMPDTPLDEVSILAPVAVETMASSSSFNLDDLEARWQRLRRGSTDDGPSSGRVAMAVEVSASKSTQTTKQ